MGMWASRPGGGSEIDLDQEATEAVTDPAGDEVQVPRLVAACTRLIEEQASDSEGLYVKLSGRREVVRLHAHFRRRGKFTEGASVEAVASLLRFWLLRIPAGVFTRKLVAQFAMHRRSIVADRFARLRALLRELPPSHRALVRHLAGHLHTLRHQCGGDRRLLHLGAQFLVPARADALAFMATQWRVLFDTRVFGASLDTAVRKSLVTYGTGPPHSVSAGAEDGASMSATELLQRARHGSAVRLWPQTLLPAPLRLALPWLNEHALDEEGLYRVPGSTALLADLRTSFDAGVHVSLPPPPDVLPETAGSLLKDFIRELPDPLMPSEVQQAVPLRRPSADALDAARAAVRRCRPAQRALLCCYFGHMKRVIARAETNLMHAGNLVIALRPRCAPVFAFCADHADALFGPDDAPLEFDDPDSLRALCELLEPVVESTRLLPSATLRSFGSDPLITRAADAASTSRLRRPSRLARLSTARGAAHAAAHAAAVHAATAAASEPASTRSSRPSTSSGAERRLEGLMHCAGKATPAGQRHRRDSLVRRELSRRGGRRSSRAMLSAAAGAASAAAQRSAASGGAGNGAAVPGPTSQGEGSHAAT